MLAEAREEAASGSTSSVSTTSIEIDWSSWVQLGSTDIYHEFPRLEDDTRPGAVEFENDIRASSDVPRIGARSDIKMEAGRLICNSSAVNADEYCDDQVVQDGFSNKGATVSHDWDHDYNDTPREDLIEDDDPDNKISDITETRSVSLELSASPDGPSGTIGYSSSVAVPGVDIVDKTVQSTGQTRHELQVSNSGEDSATTTAEFEIGSTAEWNPSCDTVVRSDFR